MMAFIHRHRCNPPLNVNDGGYYLERQWKCDECGKWWCWSRSLFLNRLKWVPCHD
jgi:hypothetical protein